MMRYWIGILLQGFITVTVLSLIGWNITQWQWWVGCLLGNAVLFILIEIWRVK